MNIYELLNRADVFIETDKFYIIKGTYISIGLMILLIAYLTDWRRMKKSKRIPAPVIGIIILALLILACLFLAFESVIIIKAFQALYYAMTELTGLCVVLGLWAVSVEIRLRRRK